MGHDLKTISYNRIGNLGHWQKVTKQKHFFLNLLLDWFFRCGVGAYPTYNLEKASLIARPYLRILGSVPCSKVPRQCVKISSPAKGFLFLGWTDME